MQIQCKPVPATVPEEDEDEDIPRPHGTIIAWGSADQVGAIGVLYIILSLILVSGGVLSDREWRYA